MTDKLIRNAYEQGIHDGFKQADSSIDMSYEIEAEVGEDYKPELRNCVVWIDRKLRGY